MSSAAATTAATSYSSRSSTNHRALNSLREGLKDYFREAHPYWRNPSKLQPHAVSVPFYARRVLRTAGMYIPCGLLIFGWPFAAKAMIQWAEGINTTPAKKVRA